MTCIYYYDNSDNAEGNFQSQQVIDNEKDDDIDGSAASSRHYKPLPTALTDFIAESLCGILETTQAPRCINWDVPLPELLFFVEKVTTRAMVDVRTAIAALVLVSRLKKKLPKNAHGEYGVCHKLFLSAILIASKYITQSRPYDSTSSTSSEEALPSLFSAESTLPIEQQVNHLSGMDTPSSIFSTIPSSASSTSSTLEDEDHYDQLSSQQFESHCNSTNITSHKLAEISGVFTIQEVNQMEKSFRRFLGNSLLWVDNDDVRNFVENNKYALGIC